MRSQDGQAAIILVLLMILGVAAGLLTFAAPASRNLDAEEATSRAFSQARDALVGFATSCYDIDGDGKTSCASPYGNERPGNLPCPDTNNDGIAEAWDLTTYECSGGYIGRFPWKTLGTEQLRDGYGEVLWYAVTRDYARGNAACITPCPLNSDTAGQYTVNTTPGFVALFFSPGTSIVSQNRDAAGVNTISNYLEGENANGDNIFVTQSSPSGTFNDRVYTIKSGDIFNVVNRRVAKEAALALNRYRNANGYLPRANRFDDPSGDCDPSKTQGRIPTNPATCGDVSISLPLFGINIQTQMAPWGNNLPTWFTVNQWNLLSYYAVSDGCSVKITSLLGLASNRATNCASLNLGILGTILGFASETPITAPYNFGAATTNAIAVVIVSGQQLTAHGLPCAGASDCFADDGVTSNIDYMTSPAAPASKVFVMPARYPTTNDKMAAICAANSTCASTHCPSASTSPCAYGL